MNAYAALTALLTHAEDVIHSWKSVCDRLLNVMVLYMGSEALSRAVEVAAVLQSASSLQSDTDQ